jgi:hypothetical protein
MRFLYYNPLVATTPRSHHIPGMKRFALFSKIGQAGVMFLDRTGTIRSPIKTVSTFPIPEFRRITTSLEDVCNERARELLNRAGALGVRLFLFYSGGIDSTLMLVSILKQATVAQRDNITVLLTEKSIHENPNFYQDHLRGKVALENSTMFHYLLGTNGLFVGAELNDLVFGSDFIRPFMKRVGLRKVLQQYDRAEVLTHFTHKLGDVPNAEKEAAFYVDTLERIRDVAPMPIYSHFDFFWWISFCLKWQFISVRMLAFTADRNAHLITADYVRNHYSHFFDTERFQLWSMNNLDKRIKDDWKTYKWPCKDIIFDYTKDADYRDNKTKQGSLSTLLVQQDPFHYIDEHFGLHRNLPSEQYCTTDNDFIV